MPLTEDGLALVEREWSGAGLPIAADLPRLASTLQRQYESISSLGVLGPSQTDLFLAQLLDPDDTGYNLAFAVELLPGTDPVLWGKALHSAEESAPTLRSRYAVLGEIGVQIQDMDARATLDVLRVENAKDAARRVIEDALSRPPELFRSAATHILVLGPDCTFAVLACHHIAIDAISAALFFRHTFRAYVGQPVRRDERFLEWAAQASTTIDEPEGVAEWRQHLQHVRPLTTYGAEAAYRESSVAVHPAEFDALRHFCATHRLSLYAVMKALVGAAIGRALHATSPYAIFDIMSGRLPSSSTVVGCLYRVVPLVFAAEAKCLRTAQPIVSMCTEFDMAAQRPHLSMATLSALLPFAGERVFFNVFDHDSLDRLLHDPAAARLEGYPAATTSEFSCHDHIQAGETHVIIERRLGSLVIRVRSRHAVLAEIPLAEFAAETIRELRRSYTQSTARSQLESL